MSSEQNIQKLRLAEQKLLGQIRQSGLGEADASELLILFEQFLFLEDGLETLALILMQEIFNSELSKRRIASVGLGLIGKIGLADLLFLVLEKETALDVVQTQTWAILSIAQRETNETKIQQLLERATQLLRLERSIVQNTPKANALADLAIELYRIKRGLETRDKPRKPQMSRIAN